MASQFIGARISLISKSDIRYVGTLHSINQVDCTIALENVKSFGTENRRAGLEKIDASPTVFEYILFRASDVKDLHVEEHKPRASDVPNDPAIITARAPNRPLTNGPLSGPQMLLDPRGVTLSKEPVPVPPLNRPPIVPNGIPKAASDSERNNRGGNLPGMGGHLLQNRRGRGGRHSNGRPHNDSPLPAADFDFETSNAKFDKSRAGQGAGDVAGGSAGEQCIPEVGQKPAEVYYDKAGFFDNISCETKERQQMGDERHNRGPGERRAKQFEERRLNVETFGQATIDNNRRRGFRSRGGFRGGFHGQRSGQSSTGPQGHRGEGPGGGGGRNGASGRNGVGGWSG